MNKRSRLRYKKGWHSYYELDGERIKHGEKLQIKIGSHFYDATAIVKQKKYQGRGGMDESYSWEMVYLNVSINNSRVKMVLEKNFNLRRKPL